MGRTTASSGPGELLARAWSSPLKAGCGRCGAPPFKAHGRHPAGQTPGLAFSQVEGVVSSSRRAAVRSPRSSPIGLGDERVDALYES